MRGPIRSPKETVVSVILPALNEMSSGILLQNAKNLLRDPRCRVICVDGGSSDGTHAELERLGLRVPVLNGSNRAQRINYGLNLATGAWTVCLHPRSRPPATFVDDLLALDSSRPLWGGWTHGFDDHHFALRFTSWYSNFVRMDRAGVVYFDHCWFFSEALMAKSVVQVPERQVFEDTELSVHLRKLVRPIRLKGVAQTSAVRFRKNGIARQALLNQLLKVGHRLGWSDQALNKLYERGLNLNRSTAKKS